MNLVELTKKDFGEIFQIALKELYSGSTRRLFTREEFTLIMFNQLDRAFNSIDCYAAGFKEHDKIVGAILGHGQKEKHIYVVDFLWISSHRRNQYHARTLMDLLFHWAINDKEYKRFITETDTKHPAVKKLAKTFGFHQARTIWTYAA